MGWENFQEKSRRRRAEEGSSSGWGCSTARSPERVEAAAMLEVTKAERRAGPEMTATQKADIAAEKTRL
jgi:hypothetical protein